jgi:hypothetical protein
MKIFNKIFLFFLFGIVSLLAQDEIKDSLIITPPKIDQVENLLFKLDEFYFYLELKGIQGEFPLNEDPNTIKLWTSAIISRADANINNANLPTHISSILYEQYREDSKFNPVKYVLGMAQAGAVGYLAYKHVKKYGFFK